MRPVIVFCHFCAGSYPHHHMPSAKPPEVTPSVGTRWKLHASSQHLATAVPLKRRPAHVKRSGRRNRYSLTIEWDPMLAFWRETKTQNVRADFEKSIPHC